VAEIHLLLTGTTLFLAILGIVMNWLGPRSSVSMQHLYAFVTIFILILATLPHLSLPQVSAGIYLNLGMMLTILQLSAYFSGTSANSSRLYAVILVLTAILMSSMAHTEIMGVSFGRFMIAAFLWLMLQQFEQVTQIRIRKPSRIEQSFLWLWVLSAVGSLLSSQIQILPDLLFLVLLIIHLERCWAGSRIISPIISLYGLVTFWFLNLTASISGEAVLNTELQLPAILVLALLIRSLMGISLSRRYFYLFLAQNIGIIVLTGVNIFQPVGELFLLMRVLLFISLCGLFVMIESKAGEVINLELIHGLFKERPRFTTAVLIVALLFTIYPAIYLVDVGLLGSILIGAILLAGLFQLFLLIQASFGSRNQPFRILRPSLSIWATVVFIILWSALTLVESLG